MSRHKMFNAILLAINCSFSKISKEILNHFLICQYYKPNLLFIYKYESIILGKFLSDSENKIKNIQKIMIRNHNNSSIIHIWAPKSLSGTFFLYISQSIWELVISWANLYQNFIGFLTLLTVIPIINKSFLSMG